LNTACNSGYQGLLTSIEDPRNLNMKIVSNSDRFDIKLTSIIEGLEVRETIFLNIIEDIIGLLEFVIK